MLLRFLVYVTGPTFANIKMKKKSEAYGNWTKQQVECTLVVKNMFTQLFQSHDKLQIRDSG